MTTAAIKLSGEQKAVLKMMEETKKNLFVTGRAGAGKSVVLREFRETTEKQIIVVAPTGIAALNVQGATIHSTFKLAPQVFDPSHPETLKPDSRLNTLLSKIDAIVFDEISMVRADLLDAVEARCRIAKNNALPFGGIQIIMFGDVFQLPPVVMKDLVKFFEQNFGGPFFFNAQCWKRTEFTVLQMEKVFRQKDPIFKDILNAVREGEHTPEQLKQLNTRAGIPVPADETIITLAPTNQLVTNINQARLHRLEGDIVEYRAFITGNMKENNFPTEEILQLKVGAQIVMLKNDQNKRYVNGSVGKIVKLTKYNPEEEIQESIEVEIKGSKYTIEKETWEEIAYEYDERSKKIKSKVLSSFTQYPIRLAWALTIHKSQGQTYEKVCLDLSTPTFAAGQMYVALSRCTSLEGLYITRSVQPEWIIVDKKVKTFMSRKEAIEFEEDTADFIEEAELIIQEAKDFAKDIDATKEETKVYVKEAIQIAEMLAPEIKKEKKAHKGGRAATGRVRKQKQYSLDASLISSIAEMTNKEQKISQDIKNVLSALGLRGEHKSDESKVDESELLEAIIKTSPLYQQLQSLLVAKQEEE